MKKTIEGKTYDTENATSIAAESTHSSYQVLYQNEEGEFFLVIHQVYVDGKRLNPHELWVDLRQNPKANGRLQCAQEIMPLVPRQALEWCVKTQIPETLRGYLLDCI